MRGRLHEKPTQQGELAGCVQAKPGIKRSGRPPSQVQANRTMPQTVAARPAQIRSQETEPARIVQPETG